MKRVFKWTVQVDDEFHPIGGGKIVHVGSQYGDRQSVQVWTEEDSERPHVRAAIIVGTGHPLPTGYTAVGTVIPVSAGGHLVWHLAVPE